MSFTTEYPYDFTVYPTLVIHVEKKYLRLLEHSHTTLQMLHSQYLQSKQAVSIQIFCADSTTMNIFIEILGCHTL